ncbi:MAG TPA: PIN domain-containing protein [Burkholderiaceae bacterium]|nr:PIN domain-containing protein [Burkholderiaceae bacterium]
MSLTHILVDFDNVKPSASDIALAHGASLRLAIVRGPQPTRYEADLAETLHAMGDHVSFSRCAKAGKNAADMQIAFHIGEIVAALDSGAERTTRFIVISRDKGFEPLMAYLRGKGFSAALAPSFKAALGGAVAAEKVAHKPAKKRAAKTPAAKAAAPVKAPAPRAPAAKKAVKKKAEAPAKAAPPPKKSAHAAKPADDQLARVIESLQRMGDNKRPAKRKGLVRHIESHLGRTLTPQQLEALVDRLAHDGVLAFDGNKVDYRLPKARR